MIAGGVPFCAGACWRGSRSLRCTATAADSTEHRSTVAKGGAERDARHQPLPHPILHETRRRDGRFRNRAAPTTRGRAPTWYASTSRGPFSAEISTRSPRKFFIFIIWNKTSFLDKRIKHLLHLIWKQKHCPPVISFHHCMKTAYVWKTMLDSKNVVILYY